jgi:hypothetical protein
VTYITPRYEFGQAHSDGTALMLGRNLEETVANIARYLKQGCHYVSRRTRASRAIGS